MINSIFSLENLCDTSDFQNDIIRLGGIDILSKVGLSDDARVRWDISHALSCLSVSEESNSYF